MNFHMLHTNYPSFLILSLTIKTKYNVLKKCNILLLPHFFFFCEQKRGGGRQMYLFK